MAILLQLYCTLDTPTSATMTPDTMVNGTGAVTDALVVVLGVVLLGVVSLGVVLLDGCTHCPLLTTNGLGHVNTQNWEYLT